MTSVGRATAGMSLPAIVLTDGTVQAIKWLALVAMTIDHVNKYLLNWAHPWMFAVGRVAMPLFALALAYNLARPGADKHAYLRTAKRMAVVGAVATAPYIAAGHVQGGWWPLNIMFTLAAAAAILALVDAERTAAAVALFVVSGAFVEFFWPALALIVAAHAYFRRPSVGALAAVVIATALLGLINGNHWAFAALATFALAAGVKAQLPRLRLVFYAYYPAHLVCLWLAQHWMRG